MIVAASLIMSTVFFSFMLNPDRVSKEFGLLLGVAILTDALLVRLTLVPALLTAAGRAHLGDARAGSTGYCRTSRSSRRASGRSRSWSGSRSRSGRAEPAGQSELDTTTSSPRPGMRARTS